MRWLGAQVLVVTTGLVVLVVVSAVVFGATTALSTGDSGYVGKLLESGLAYLPAELVIAGVAVLLYGFIPRAFALAWAAFAAVTFIGLLGSGLQLPDWILNLSPLTHVGKPPIDDIDATALAWLALVASVIGSAAFVGFRRRRVPRLSSSLEAQGSYRLGFEQIELAPSDGLGCCRGAHEPAQANQLRVRQGRGGPGR